MTRDDPRDGVTLAIARAKLTRYLLDPGSRYGRAKAKYFLSKGFTTDGLEQALLAHGRSGSLAGTRWTAWGMVFEVTGAIALPTGGSARILTAWQIDEGSPQVARLLTAHLD